MTETQQEKQLSASPDFYSQPVALLARFRACRAATLAFTAPLSPEDMMVQSSPDASPVKWHLAHTSWFFETFVLTPYATGYKPFHPDFAWLFNSYYTSLGDMPAKDLRSSFSRPALSAIRDYRASIDHAIEALLTALPPEHAADILRRVTLGLQHEQQHLELIATDIKHALFTNPLHPALIEAGAPRHSSETRNPDEPTYTSFAGGLIPIGITPSPAEPDAFAFDNEMPRHQVFLQPFALANRLVIAAEYLGFINDNGYTRPELWLSEGWAAIRREGWQAPLYWQRTPHPYSDAHTGWSIFTFAGFQPLDALLHTPVCHLSLFEADAFARWAGKRLPTEFEWEHAASTVFPSPASNMLEAGHLHPTPAAPAPGLQQISGDVWEWTASGYTGYPGYKPLPGALGEYNGKFMSSQVILRGGSCVTPRTHIRPTYRNFFPPSTRWQFSGLRLAHDL